MGQVSIYNFGASGIAKDSREPSISKCAYVQNFDVLGYPYQLNPYRGMVANQTTSFGIRDFLYGDFGIGIGTNIFALGRQVALDRVEPYIKSGDLVTSSWTAALSVTGTATLTRSTTSNLWILYKDYTYYATGARYIGRIGLMSSGSAATLTDTHFDLTSFTSVTQGVIHPKDDILYVGVNNKIYKKDATAAFALGITLPSYLTVNSVAPWGNYLALACSPTNIIGNSIVYIWDRNSALATLTESIDWGNGELNVLENLDGELVGVSFTGRTSFNLLPRLIIKKWNGGAPTVIREFISTSSVGTASKKKYKSGSNLYFTAQFAFNGSTRQCLFTVGKDEAGNFVVAGDININNDTAVSGNVNGFVKFDDIWFVAFNDDGSVNRTVSDGSFSGTSIWESLVNHSMPIDDRHLPKKLVSVAVSYKKLSSTAQVVLKHKIDGGSYVTDQTDNVDDSVNMEATATSAGDSLGDGREFEFRVESTGGAMITEVAYYYDVLTNQTHG